jgi:hypothetical protein
MGAADTLEALRVSWQAVKDCYDLTDELPGWDCVLDGVDLSRPEEAACMILVNLLTAAMEQVDRFNPWYKAPAEAFGLCRQPQGTSMVSSGWGLTSEAMERWRPTLSALACALACAPELTEAQASVNGTRWSTRSVVAATCACDSAPIVLVSPCMLLDSTLRCNICGQPLHVVE